MSFSYDRCPNCHGPTWFVQITMNRGEWLRWIQCQICSLFIVMDEFGALVRTSRDGPPKPKVMRDGKDAE